MNVYQINEAIFDSLYSNSDVCTDLNHVFHKNLDRDSYYDTALNKEVKK